MFIYIPYMFQAAMCPSPGELLHQCDTFFMSLCNIAATDISGLAGARAKIFFF